MAWLLGMFLLLAAGNYDQTSNDVVADPSSEVQPYVADGGGGFPPTK